MVRQTWKGLESVVPLQLAPVPPPAWPTLLGGVSSLGINGTIAHVVVRVANSPLAGVSSVGDSAGSATNRL